MPYLLTAPFKLSGCFVRTLGQKFLGQHFICNQSRRTVLSGKAEVSAAGPMRVVLAIQNEVLMKLYQLDCLTNSRNFWDFAVVLHEGAKLVNVCYTDVTFRRVNIDSSLQNKMG